MNLSRNKVLLLALALIALFSLLIDFHCTRKYAGIDLRDKLVGSRSLIAGRSLYFEPWRPGEPETFADPMVPAGAEMTRYTGTPFQALLTAPLAILPYKVARFAWLPLQYALLILAAWLAAMAVGQGTYERVRAITIVLAIMLASSSWRLHVERGQLYVLPAFLIACIFAATIKGRPLLAGVLETVLILIKPTYGLLLAPLIFSFRPKYVTGGLITLGAATLCFAVIPKGFLAWQEYAQAMEIWQHGMEEGPKPPPGAIHFPYPSPIEGVTDPASSHPMSFQNGSILSILHGFGIMIPGWITAVTYAAFLAAGAVVLRKRLQRLGPVGLLLVGYCCWTVLMWLLPAPRFNYQAVHWVAPLVAVLISFPKKPYAWRVAAIITAALFLGAWKIVPLTYLLADMMMVGLTGWLLWKGTSPLEPAARRSAVPHAPAA